jgi:hypothetical protein
MTEIFGTDPSFGSTAATYQFPALGGMTNASQHPTSETQEVYKKGLNL